MYKTVINMGFNTIIAVLATLAIVTLLAYGIKYFFDFKAGQGKETSNTPIRKAIGSLLIAFIAMVGLGPMIVDIIVQLLNNIPGVHLKSTQNSEIIGIIAFIVFCLTLGWLIAAYYRYRGRLYHGDRPSGSSGIISGKNIVKDSKIKAGGNIHIGDK